VAKIRQLMFRCSTSQDSRSWQATRAEPAAPPVSPASPDVRMLSKIKDRERSSRCASSRREAAHRSAAPDEGGKDANKDIVVRKSENGCWSARDGRPALTARSPARLRRLSGSPARLRSRSSSSAVSIHAHAAGAAFFRERRIRVAFVNLAERQIARPSCALQRAFGAPAWSTANHVRTATRAGLSER